MSDTDEYMSSDDSSTMQASEESDSDEIKAVGLVEPYANEQPAHSSADDEDDEEDQKIQMGFPPQFYAHDSKEKCQWMNGW